MKSKLEKFQLFLGKYKVQSGLGKTFTHTSMSGGLWNIPDNQLRIFFNLYAKAVTESELHMTEKHIYGFGPIVIDFDFEFSQKNKPRLINKIIRDNIVNYLIKTLKEIFGTDHDYTCIVLQRPHQYKKIKKKQEIWSDGLHIQFPFIVCEYIFQYALRNKFMDNFNFGIECTNSMNEIYDESVIYSNGWCLYLSTKKDKDPYDVVDIYNSELVWEELSTLKQIKLLSIRNKSDINIAIPVNYDCINSYIKQITKPTKKITASDNFHKSVNVSELIELESNQEYDIKKIIELLDMLNYDRVDNYLNWIKIGFILHTCSITDKNNKVNDDKNNKVNDDKNVYLQIWDEWSQKSPKYEKDVCNRQWKSFSKIKGNYLTFGSLIYYAKTDNPFLFLKDKIKDELIDHEKLFIKVDLSIRNIISKEHICIVELSGTYCPFVNRNHSDKTLYLEINQIGICLKCQKCLYQMMPNNGPLPLPNDTLKHTFNIKPIRTDIKLNNICEENFNNMEIDDVYQIFTDPFFNKLMYEGLNMTAYDFAIILHYLYKDKLNYTKSNKWYVFNKHRWIQDDSEISNIISVQLVNYYKEMKKFYCHIAYQNNKNADSSSDDTEGKTEVEMRIETITKIIKQLKSTGFKSTIIVEAGHIFYKWNSEFENFLDKKLHLFGCNNGVFDLDADVFRDGRPNDYITMSCGYDYDTNAQHEEDIMTILGQIMPIENIAHYLLKSFGSCLSGYTKKQKVLLLNGEGSNGKSLLMALMKKTLGSYFAKGPISLITQKRTAAEQASPQINKMRTARLVMFSEPNKTDILNSGLLRELTGGEDITNRGLHEAPTDYIPQFKPYILCNYLPNVDDNSYGVWRRLRNIIFPSLFVDNPNPRKKNQYKLNDTIEDSFNSWKQSFLNILIRYYRLYKKEGLLDIPEIMESTDKYKKDSDFFQDFTDEYIEKTNFATDYIEWNTLKRTFEKWYNVNYHKSPPNTKIIQQYFSTNVFQGTIKQFRIPKTPSKDNDVTLKNNDKHSKDNSDSDSDDDPNSKDVRYRGWKFFKLINTDRLFGNLDFID
jgi:P4 family phage/plasmid primase-like protien